MDNTGSTPSPPEIQIRYPAHVGPTLACGGVSRHVVALSREALVISASRQAPLRAGQALAGELHFSDGKRLKVAGTVGVTLRNEVLVTLDRPLPVERYECERRWGAVLADRRKFFRLRYPADEILFLTIAGRRYRLTEISEHGIVYYCPEELAFHLRQAIQATLTFQDGEVLHISGTVLRMTREEVVAYLPVGIPEQRVSREQQRLIRRLRAREERARGDASPEMP